jgi:hypothetical protein
MEPIKNQICAKCKELKPITSFPRNPSGSIRRHDCYTCRGRRDRAKQKLEMLAEYGWKCQCCGEDNPYFLTLDHVNNDGHLDTINLNSGQIYAKAKKEGWPKDKYTCLCINCNFAKGHWGKCPHESGLNTTAIIAMMQDDAMTIGYSYRGFNNQYTGIPSKVDPMAAWKNKIYKMKTSDPATAALLEKALNLVNCGGI